MSSENVLESSLRPTLSVFDVVALTVSSATPASSLFVIAPFAIAQAGSGAFLAYVMAALLALMFAFCYSELGRAHNSAGGEYVYAKRVFGGMAGYVTFFTVIISLLFIPPVLATGAATYLNSALQSHFDAQTVALIIVISAYGLSILNIKLNAWITGICLFVEIAALLIIVWFGFSNVSQPASILFEPHIAKDGVLQLAPLTLIIGAVGIALFSYNGFGPAVLFAEDMKCKGQGVHKAVLWSLMLVVVLELLPLTALLLGAPSLSDLIANPDPIGYLLSSHSNETTRRIVSGGIFLSVFNAIIAIVIMIGRLIFSSGRDALWTPGLNRLFTSIHPRFASPWLATLFLAIPSALLTFTSNLAELTSFSVLLLTLIYIVVGACALMSRVMLRDRLHPYRMPLWPFPALLALVGSICLLVHLIIQASARDLAIIVALLFTSGGLYWQYGRFNPIFQKV